jgi:phospholipid/cholesterol/gamma-HCH transport system substrate-binding protein
MDTKVNYALVGFFVIILFALIIFLFVWLSGYTQHKTYQTYLVYASGGVGGLTVDSPVYFNGVKVGTVNRIQLDSENQEFVKLYLKIDSDTQITQSTIATLVPQGITGLVNVGLKSQSGQAPVLKPESGKKYAVIPYQKPLLTQLSEVLPEITKDMSEIANKFKKVIDEPNLQNFRETLNHLNNITDTLDKSSDNIRESLKSMKVFMKNSAEASRHFDKTLEAAQNAASQLRKTTQEMGLQFSNASQQLLPNIEDLVTHLNDTATNLQQVSQDLQKNPSILLRGKQPAAPGPGEK